MDIQEGHTYTWKGGFSHRTIIRFEGEDHNGRLLYWKDEYGQVGYCSEKYFLRWATKWN